MALDKAMVILNECIDPEESPAPFVYERYTGSGRPTGRIANDLELAFEENWCQWNGTMQEFEDFFLWEEHLQCHNGRQSHCPHCKAMQ